MATEYFISQLNQTMQIGVSGDAIDAVNLPSTVVYRDVDVTIDGNLNLFNDIFYVYSDSSYNVNAGNVDSAEDISYAANVDNLLTALRDVLNDDDPNVHASSIENFAVSDAPGGSQYRDNHGPNNDGASSQQGLDFSSARGTQVPEDYLGNLAYRLTNLPRAGDVISNKEQVLEDVNDKFIKAFVLALGTGLKSSDDGTGVTAGYEIEVTSADDLSGTNLTVVVAEKYGVTGEVFDSFIARELLAQWFDRGRSQLDVQAQGTGGRVKMKNFFVAGDTLSFLIQLNMPAYQLDLVNGQAVNRRTTRVYKINVILN